MKKLGFKRNTVELYDHQMARLFTKMREKFEIVKLSVIEKGWSEDKKYCITKADGSKYLLRISPISRFKTRKVLFEIIDTMMKQAQDVLEWFDNMKNILCLHGI